MLKYIYKLTNAVFKFIISFMASFSGLELPYNISGVQAVLSHKNYRHIKRYIR